VWIKGNIHVVIMFSENSSKGFSLGDIIQQKKPNKTKETTHANTDKQQNNFSLCKQKAAQKKSCELSKSHDRIRTHTHNFS
jgi:hypothetical protein